MVKGISHITFTVKDLDKSTRFFKEIFNAKEIYSSGENTFSISKEKFFLIGELWIAIMEGEELPTRTYNHIAFKVDDEEFDLYKKKVIDLGVDIKTGRTRIEGEAKSIYFYDYDNHLFEIHTGTLQERLNRYTQK